MTTPISFAQVTRTATGQWSLWGPNSGGGASVYLCGDVVHLVVYGDESPLPLGAEHVSTSLPVDVYLKTYAALPQHARAVADIQTRLAAASGVERTAHCACGQLRALTHGEPKVVSMCHCLECQRRSGSPFGLGAWFEKAAVDIQGEHRTFTRMVEDRRVINHFCPNCGGPVFWEADGRPGWVAVAVGMFADPNFPPPARSVYEDRKHAWLQFNVDNMEHIP